MSSHVTSKITALGECFVTLITLKWLLACVNSLVFNQLCLQAERFTTKLTNQFAKHFRHSVLTSVLFVFVLFHKSNCGESIATRVTVKGTLAIVVVDNVVLATTLVEKSAWTVGTLERFRTGRVEPHVTLEAILLQECFATRGTLMSISLNKFHFL